jgi:hypothetical protein
MNNINRSLLAILMISLFSLAAMASIGSLVNSNQSVLGETIPPKIAPPVYQNPTTKGIPCDEINRLQKQYCSVGSTTPPSQPIITPTPVACSTLYWFDNTYKNCTAKSFCGNYLYRGLQTFKTRDECLKLLVPADTSSKP